jgi:hypothetical protein
MQSYTTQPTWQTLCQLEPRLLLLERELLASPPMDGDWHVYEQAKQRLRPLVGWGRRDGHDVLGSSAAWEVAIDAVLSIIEREARRA